MKASLRPIPSRPFSLSPVGEAFRAEIEKAAGLGLLDEPVDDDGVDWAKIRSMAGQMSHANEFSGFLCGICEQPIDPEKEGHNHADEGK